MSIIDRWKNTTVKNLRANLTNTRNTIGLDAANTLKNLRANLTKTVKNIDRWKNSNSVKNYERMNAKSENQQEMLEIMQEVADGVDKSEARERLNTLRESFLTGKIDAKDFRDAYTDYYTEYEKKD